MIEYSEEDVICGTVENPEIVVIPHRWHGTGKQVLVSGVRVWEIWCKSGRNRAFCGKWTGASRQRAYDKYIEED